MPVSLKKYSSAEWKTNPKLAQVQEALREVEHIKASLKKLEALAQPPTPASAGSMGKIASMGIMAALAGKPGGAYTDIKNVENWVNSLIESEIGLCSLFLPQTNSAQTLVARRRKFMDEQLTSWAMMSMGKGAAKAGKQVAESIGKMFGK